jgi:hypothetical protein
MRLKEEVGTSCSVIAYSLDNSGSDIISTNYLRDLGTLAVYASCVDTGRAAGLL